MQVLIDGGDLSAGVANSQVDDDYEAPALIMSVMNQLRWMFDKLMECELTDVNAVGYAGWTALHRAAEKTDAYYATRLCAHEDIDINLQDVSGYSPIMWAAYGDDRASSAVVLLAQPQLDLSPRDSDGETALDLANTYSPAVDTLIQNELTRRDHKRRRVACARQLCILFNRARSGVTHPDRDALEELLGPVGAFFLDMRCPLSCLKPIALFVASPEGVDSEPEPAM